MKKKTKSSLLSIMLILVILSTLLILLSLSTLPGLAQTWDEGYPAPTEDIGYPIYWYGYPDPVYSSSKEVVSELSFTQELQAEVKEIEEVIRNVQPRKIKETHTMRTLHQAGEIIKYYFGQMIMRVR